MMNRVWNCLENQHDWRLVLLAACVCLLASLTASHMFQRARATWADNGRIWLVSAGCVTGFGVWATHFIAMLGYMPAYGFRYNLDLTVVSLAIAAMMTTIGFAVGAFGGSRTSFAIGGMIVGIGIALMHYIGMAALDLVIVWDVELLALSVALGIGFMIGAALVSVRGESALQTNAAAVLLALGVLSVHFVGMGAINPMPRPVVEAGHLLLSPVALGLAIAAVVAALLISGLFGVAIDRRMHRRITERNVLLGAALNNMGQGLVMFDAHEQLALWNEQYAAIYRYPPGSLRVGATMNELLDLRTQAGTVYVDIERHHELVAAANVERIATNWMAHIADGRSIYITLQPMPNGGWVATHEDQTEKMAIRARIEHMAMHDPLTDLANRAALDAHMAMVIEQAQRDGSRFAVICIDLDRFKEINDLNGHTTGDDFLREVARRLTVAADGGFVARVGGDEFIMVIATGEQPAAAERRCARIVELFSAPFAIGDNVISGGCSIGAAIYPRNGQSIETLIANADAALYRAKSDGRGAVRFFENRLDTSLHDIRRLQKELTTALARNEFEPYFQPQVTATGEIIGFEVLARWNHPSRGLVLPGVFVPLAEQTGVIRAIDEAILRKACIEAASWPNRLTIAVNLSPVDFRSGGIAAMIIAILFESGLSPKRLMIEITEGVLIEDLGRATAELRKIKDIGVGLAMDDFGTGYSSLSYLQAFPFDKIKIDRSFVAQLGRHPQSDAIVTTIIALGRNLDLVVIAEGVETEAQRAYLIEQGCDQMQGYLIGHPKPIDYYQRLIERPESSRDAKAS